jgi:DNA-binding HxlR family transcriptional regulator
MARNEREFVFDPAGEQSPVVGIHDRKWTPAIVERLVVRGELRYSELADEVEGISDKVLSDSLKHLEEHGLVERRVVETRPVAVTYSLTPAGAALEDVIDAVGDWVDEHAEARSGPPAASHPER